MTSSWGIEITKIELSEIKVLKDGENIALETFTKVSEKNCFFFHWNFFKDIYVKEKRFRLLMITYNIITSVDYRK